jgi:hypothetical protein
VPVAYGEKTIPEREGAPAGSERSCGTPEWAGWALGLPPEPGAGPQLAEDVTESQAPLSGRLGGHREAASFGPAAVGRSPAQGLTAQVQLIDRRQGHASLGGEDVCEGSTPGYGMQ